MTITGKLKFEEENFNLLIEDAHTLGFQFVTELCDEHVLQEVTSENWASVLSCSHYSQNEDVIKRCFSFLKVVCVVVFDSQHTKVSNERVKEVLNY